MCNVWNTNACGYGCCNTNNWLNTLFGNTTQSICRDCCGNIRVNQCQNTCCGCHCCHSCGCGCGCGNDSGSTSTDNGNGNNGGRFACFTVCGNTNSLTQSNTANALNGDQYYARQYGLYGYNNSSCGCGYNG